MKSVIVANIEAFPIAEVSGFTEPFLRRIIPIPPACMNNLSIKRLKSQRGISLEWKNIMAIEEIIR